MKFSFFTQKAVGFSHIKLEIISKEKPYDRNSPEISQTQPEYYWPINTSLGNCPAYKTYTSSKHLIYIAEIFTIIPVYFGI